jgi:signal transduction histidine kinase/ActR/RegA family two-component response regulator
MASPLAPSEAPNGPLDGLRAPVLNARQRKLLALLGWLLLATVISLTAWALAPLLVDQSSDEIVRYRDIQFRMLPTDTDAGSDWEAVTLPDTWPARGLKGRGVGAYDIRFDIEAPPKSRGAGAWALRIDRLSFQHEIRLNGFLVRQEIDEQGANGRPLAYLMQIPPEMLRVGDNRLEIVVHHGSMGGLSMPIIGLATQVGPGHRSQVFLTEVLPLTVNVISAAFSLFLILIWVRRPSETALGMLGLLSLAVSVRNASYYLPHGLSLNPEVRTWMYVVAQNTNTVLLGGFAMAMARQRWLVFERLLWAMLIGVPLVAGVAAALGHAAEARALIYPALIGLMLPTLYLLLKVPRQYGGLAGVGMVLGIAISLVAAVHDYLRLQGIVSVMDTYWMSLATPITLGFYSVVVTNRFVQAIHTVEQYAATLEAKVVERTAELEAANAAKGHFLAAASHDLRQPVAAVGLLAGLLREKLKGSLLADLTVRLTQAVRSMEGLLSGLLDLSRLEAGAIKPHPQPVPMHDLLQRIATHEAEGAKVKGLQMRVHPTRAVAHSDPVLLEQMVRNLIGNAVRYTSKGGVLVGVRPQGSHLSIEVWDTGGGIAPRDQKRIFEDFVQLGNPERNQARGLGLGLGIVQRASRLMDHPISLNSRVGRGTVFRIHVPRAQAHQVAAPAPQEPVQLIEGKPLSELHVVVVDDDEAVRTALRMRLKEWGAHVSAVESLEDLDELLCRVMHIDLLITDHGLCDGNGLQAIEMCRARHAGLPALVVTGDTSAEHLKTLMDTGAPVLHKPFQADGLLRVIQLLLSVKPADASAAAEAEAITSPRCSSA